MPSNHGYIDERTAIFVIALNRQEFSVRWPDRAKGREFQKVQMVAEVLVKDSSVPTAWFGAATAKLTLAFLSRAYAEAFTLGLRV